MVSKGRKLPTPRDLKRNARKRPPEYVIEVFCEGKTEAQYLRHLAREYRRPGVAIKIVGQQGDPKAVVQKAVSRYEDLKRESKKSSFGKRFEVWVVVDRDEHAHFDEAAKQCADKKIGFAWTNPCVELWALLHFRDQTAHVDRHTCQRALREFMPKYDHEDKPLFQYELMTERGLVEARKRALHLHARTRDAGHEMGNPTTTLWKLVDVLRHGSSTEAQTYAAEIGDGSLEEWRSGDPGDSPPPET